MQNNKYLIVEMFLCPQYLAGNRECTTMGKWLDLNDDKLAVCEMEIPNLYL